jgi:DNA transformation protein
MRLPTRPLLPKPSGTMATASKKRSAFVDHLHEVFERFGPLQMRPMFGGHGVYHQGVMIGLVADDMLYLKADGASKERYTAAGCEPFRYVKNGVPMTLSYYAAPAEVFDRPEAARQWAELAWAAARRARKGRKQED